jgi:hypothetical protein
MQGRKGQGDNGQNSLDHSSTTGYRFADKTGKYQSVNGTGAYRFSDLTGRQPVIPKRPPGMERLDQPPSMPRVARPEPRRRERKPKTWKWWLGALILSVFALIAISGIAYGATNFFLAVSVSAGSANTASDFLSNLQDANYAQAYNDLGPNITVQLSQSSFAQAATADDRCYGKVTNYTEVNGSATSSADGNTQSFTYTITRSKLTKPYQMQLTLQKDAAGNWLITSYGNDLGPAPPPTSCR